MLAAVAERVATAELLSLSPSVSRVIAFGGCGALVDAAMLGGGVMLAIFILFSSPVKLRLNLRSMSELSSDGQAKRVQTRTLNAAP